jgi:hypothetical protein
MPKFISNLEKLIFDFFGGAKSNMKPFSLDGMIFGMPPGTHVSDGMIVNSMPTATIIPCEPEFSKGASLFTLNQSTGWKKYTEILNSVGYTMSGTNRITVAYQVDSFPTDSFSNEYGETMFDRATSGVSQTVGDMSQVLGLTDTEDIRKVTGSIPGVGGSLVKAGDKIGDMYGDFIDSLEKNGHTTGSHVAKLFGSSLAAAATGARIDFPMVWKNSSFTPSYAMTIRLYNPNPGDPDSTKKYIVGPIAALLSLALPKVGGKDVASYKWPLFCKVLSPGLYNLNSGFISNISIIKGGDQQNIAYNQSMGMCDVRIEFGSLYSSMIAGEGSNKYSDIRPTLGNYLEVLGGKKFSGTDSVVRTLNTKEIFDTTENPENYSIVKGNVRVENPGPSIPSRVADAVVDAAGWLKDQAAAFFNG